MLVPEKVSPLRATMLKEPVPPDQIADPPTPGPAKMAENAICPVSLSLGMLLKIVNFTSCPVPGAMSPERTTRLNESVQSLKYPHDYDEATDRIDLAIIGAAWESDWVAKTLDSNAIALERFERAFETDALQIRVVSNYGEQQVLGGWLMLTKLRALELRRVALGGEPERALQSLLVLAHFGTRIREIDGGRMIHYLTGTSVIRVALSAIQSVLKDASVDPELANQLVRSLDGMRLKRDGWARVARGDYQWIKAVLDESVAARESAGPRVSRDPFARDVLESLLTLAPRWYSLQRNRTLARLAGHYRDSISTSVSSVSSTCAGVRCREEAAPIVQNAPSVYSIERNALGNYWADLAQRSIQIYQPTGRVSESMVSAVQVMIALRAFEGTRGRMPAKLDELVPEYLDHVPLDYFDGHAIRYSSDQHLIYSVGSDLADAQGQWNPGASCHSELSFPIPFATEGRAAAVRSLIICGASRS